MRWVLALLFMLSGLVGWGHDLGMSGIRLIHRSHDCVLSVLTHVSKVDGQDASSFVHDRLKVRLDGQLFEPSKGSVIKDDAADMLIWQATIPHPVQEVEVLQRLFPERPRSYTLFSEAQDGQVVREVILDQDHPSLLLAGTEASTWSTAGSFIVKGIEHILSGADHVMFVLGLLLLGGNLKSLFKTVTAFTLAHSITLSLAVTRLLNPPSRVIEPLIALSIVAIAIENLRRKQTDARPWVAFGFGLIHGFGFAGALLDAGLSRASLGAALVSFNVGVELGQACIILIAFPLILWLSRLKPLQWRQVATAGSVVIGMVGSYWFVSRVLYGS